MPTKRKTASHRKTTVAPKISASTAAQTAMLVQRLLAEVRPRNHGRPWGLHDSTRVRQHLESGNLDLRPIARELGRTAFAVFMRAVSLRLMNEFNVYQIWRASVAEDGGMIDLLSRTQEILNETNDGRALEDQW